MTNTNEMQNAVALWIEANETQGSADAVALVALVAIGADPYLVTVGDREVAVTLRDIVANPDAKTRTAARNGFFVAFGGFEAGQAIPNACLAGLNRVIRAALLLIADGVAPTLKTVKANGRETSALAGLPLAMCADFPLRDDKGQITPDFLPVVEREVEYLADKGEDVSLEDAANRLAGTPVTLHPVFKARGKLKPLTRLMSDLSKEAVATGIVPAPKGRAPRTAQDEGSSLMADVERLLAALETIAKSDECEVGFTAAMGAKLYRLADLAVEIADMAGDPDAE
jgi:hypothetical protein